MKLISRIYLSTLNRKLTNLLPRIRTLFNKAIVKTAPREILTSIGAGISPVAGQGRFQKYASSYSLAIQAGVYKQYGKTTRPVNMKLSGGMLKALKAAIQGDRVRVTMNHELADIHNRQGAGKSKVLRRLLPTKKGETFSRALMAYLINSAKKAARTAIKGR